MVCVVQRVQYAAVSVAGSEVARIGPGLLLLVGIAKKDGPDSTVRLAEYVSKLRVLEDAEGRMGRSLLDGGEVLAVSQFTLLADFSKGNRPSFHHAMASEAARTLFDSFVAELSTRLGRPVQTGVFGATMRVDLANDGPATFTVEA